MSKLEKILKVLVFIGLLSLIILIFSQKIELTTSDLGRHLENGRTVLTHREVLFSNYYSYTEPNNPFINHHWLAGVIYYGLFLIGGFKALTVFNIALITVAFGLAFRLAKRSAGFYWSAFLSLPVILLLSERVEVRPEIFSYFFIFLIWSWLEAVKYRRKTVFLWLIPLLMVFWVNIHVYFFIGLVLIGIYALASFLEALFSQSGAWLVRARSALIASRSWWLALISAVLASLINPNHWRGLFYPFQIFNNYGYEIAENKTVFYLQNLNFSLNYQIFEFLLLLAMLSLVVAIFKFKDRIISILISIFFAVLGCFAVRNISLFGLTALVIVSLNFSSLTAYRFYGFIHSWFRRFFTRPIYFSILLVFLISVTIFYFLTSPLGQNGFLKGVRGWGLETSGLGSADFFLTNNLPGPIFNNYDIGSALIFWLSGREKVFVDNRPEAYSVSFFNDLYKPMQLETSAWENAYKKYGFQSIYFAYTDSTPWARQFLTRILADQNWSLVYFDSYTIILIPRDVATRQKIAEIDFWKFRSALRQQAVVTGLKGKFNLASLAALAGQADLAGEIYKDILFEYPDNTRNLVFLSSYYAGFDDRNSLNLALNYLDRAYQSGYRLPEFYNQQGLINWRLGEYQKAETAWHSALRLDKSNVAALYYLDQVKTLQLQGKLPLLK